MVAGRDWFSRFILALHLCRFLFRYHLYHLRLRMAKRHFIAHYLVFYGILKGRVLKHVHHLSFDESHLDDAFTESAMSCHLDYDSALSCF